MLALHLPSGERRCHLAWVTSHLLFCTLGSSAGPDTRHSDLLILTSLCSGTFSCLAWLPLPCPADQVSSHMSYRPTVCPRVHLCSCLVAQGLPFHLSRPAYLQPPLSFSFSSSLVSTFEAFSNTLGHSYLPRCPFFSLQPLTNPGPWPSQLPFP